MTAGFLLRALGIGAAAVCLQLAAIAGASAQAIVEGAWMTQLGSEITIEQCETGYCGRISKIVVPQKYKDQYGAQLDDIAVEDYFDYNNKDPALRARPVLNLQILTMRATGNPWRFDGEVYNPEDGEIYAGFLEVVGADTIKLNGCILYGLVCRGEEWQRVLTPPEEAPAQ